MQSSFDIDQPGGDERAQRRVALNQATLRRLNEAMHGRSSDGLTAFRCECGQLGCNQLVELRRGEYESIRAHPRRFAIVPGHEVVEIEGPVERNTRYTVVEARAAVAVGVAEETTPRDARGARRS